MGDRVLGMVNVICSGCACNGAVKKVWGYQSLECENNSSESDMTYLFL